MRLKLQDLQEYNSQTQKVRVKSLPESWKDVEGVLNHQGLFFVPKTIQTELISQNHDNLLASHFEINKI